MHFLDNCVYYGACFLFGDLFWSPLHIRRYILLRFFIFWYTAFGCHQRELNQTAPRFRRWAEWATFENGRKTLFLFPFQKRGSKNCPFLIILRRHIRATVFGTRRAIDKLKYHFKPQRFPTFYQNFVNFGPQRADVKWSILIHWHNHHLLCS